MTLEIHLVNMKKYFTSYNTRVISTIIIVAFQSLPTLHTVLK